MLSNSNADWGPLVDVVGYCFLNLGSNYQPREEFVQWLQKEPKPIYIGFGSMVCLFTYLLIIGIWVVPLCLNYYAADMFNKRTLISQTFISLEISLMGDCC